MDRDKIFKKVLLVFKVCYLSYLLLAFNAFVNGMDWMNKASYVITLFGAGMILWMVFLYKRYIHGYNLWILALFTISYAMSALLHFSYGGTENIKGLIWLVFPFILLYMSSFNMSAVEIRKEIKWLSPIYIFYITITNFISITMVYWGRKYDYTDGAGTVHGIGYRWERLWGAYDDPNHGATITVIGLFLLIYLFSRTKTIWKRVSIILIFLINFIYLSLSDSRTGVISLVAGMLITGFLIAWTNRKKKSTVKQMLLPLLCAVLVGGVVVAGDVAVKQIYHPIEKKIVNMLKPKNVKPAQPVKNETRQLDLKSDYSNGRIGIWENGLQIIEESPIVGVGYRNIVQYAKTHFPNGYLMKNELGVKYDSMHNLEMDVLVGQGVLGGVIFLIFAGNVCVILFKKFHLAPAEYNKEALLSASIAAALLIAGTFLSFIFYVNAPQNMMFWLFLGYTMRFCQIGADKKK